LAGGAVILAFYRQNPKNYPLFQNLIRCGTARLVMKSLKQRTNPVGGKSIQPENHCESEYK
jgi:hypothetical protein